MKNKTTIMIVKNICSCADADFKSATITIIEDQPGEQVSHELLSDKVDIKAALKAAYDKAIKELRL